MTHRQHCLESRICRCFCKQCWREGKCVCRRCQFNKDGQELLAFDHLDFATGKVRYPKGPWPRAVHRRMKGPIPDGTDFPSAFCRRCARQVPTKLRTDDDAGRIYSVLNNHTRYEGGHVIRCPGSNAPAEPSATEEDILKMREGHRDLAINWVKPAPEPLPDPMVGAMAAAMAIVAALAEDDEGGESSVFGPPNSPDIHEEPGLNQEGCD